MSSGLRRVAQNPMDVDLETLIQNKRGRFNSRRGFSRQNMRNQIPRNRAFPSYNSSQLDSLPFWRKDRFQNLNGSGTSGSSQVIVRNLHYGVNEDDLTTLFSEFGRLLKVEIHYDRAGRSLGEARVLFADSGDAAYASKKYNGVPLDGMPMTISVGGEESQRDGGFRRGGGQFRRMRRGRGFGKRSLTVQQLDAQLEDYRNQAPTI